MTLRLGEFEIDAQGSQLRRHGVAVPLEPQPLALLRLLASRPGELVTHDEIRAHLWADGTHVNFHDAVHYCVRQVRLALGDSARDPRFIQTVPRRGYRFMAAPAVQRPPRRPRAAWIAAAAAAVVVLTAVAERRPNDHHQIAVALLTRAHDLVFR